MKMVKAYKGMVVMLMLIGTITSLGSAGQIVTQDMRQWAQDAVQREKELATVSESNTIAVLYFQNLSGRTDLDPYQKGLAVMLISDLSRLDKFTVIERAELQALVEELGLGQTGLVDPAGAPRIGRLLRAENLIGGAFHQDVSDPVNIGASILEVGPSKATELERIKGDLAGLIELEKKVLQQIIATLKLELTPQQQEALKTPLSRDPLALLELFKGIDAGDHGRYAKAAEHYSRALEADPGLELARQSLEELNALGLLKDTAQRRRMLRHMRQQTSFSTTLNPPLPLSRIPQPSGVGTLDTRIDQNPDTPPFVDTIPDTPPFVDTIPDTGGPAAGQLQPDRQTPSSDQ